MSVVPQEDNLVMSFAEATRIFNYDQSNTGHFVSGTGDASQQLPQGVTSPTPITSRPSYSRLEPAATGPQRGNSLHRPFTPVDGPASVVPAVLPTRQQIAEQPQAMVEIRNPAAGVQIDDDLEDYSNPWFSFRTWMRVYFAEFLGTMVLVLWGEGTQAQVVAARQTPNDYLSIAFGWGIGFMLAIYISSGISGGHINPAVTISLAIFRKFSWRKVPGYVAAQLLGAFAGAAVIYGVYWGPLHALEQGYAGVLTTGPASLLPSVAATFFSVFTGAALLMGAISAFTDTGNNPATPGLTPLLLGFIMVGIASGFGYQTGFVLNPARDLGPRLLVWATGEGGRQLWLKDSAYGIWTPTVGTIAGALFGNALYDLLIYNGRDSPINMNFSKSHKRRQRELRRQRDTEGGVRQSASGLSDATLRDARTSEGYKKNY